MLSHSANSHATQSDSTWSFTWLIAIASLFSKSSFMIGVMRRMSVPTIMGEDTAHTHTHTHNSGAHVSIRAADKPWHRRFHRGGSSSTN